MGVFGCFSSLKNKKNKGRKKPLLQVKVERLENGPEASEAKTSSFSVPVPFSVPESSTCEVKVVNHVTPVPADTGEADYEGGDEHDESLSMKRDYSDLDLQGHADQQCLIGEKEIIAYESHDNTNDETTEEGDAGGHVSDPGTRKEQEWPLPKLKRSCSDLLMKRHEFAEDHEVKVSSSSRFGDKAFIGGAASPAASVVTHRSADKVILKKHSSSQILPSGSRKLWWKLFLWSHRNLHRTGLSRPHPVETEPALNQQGGYCSDTVESGPAAKDTEKVGSRSPGSYTGELADAGSRSSRFYGVSGMWPQNQWVALPTESSPFNRVDEWVKEASLQPPFSIEVDGDGDQSDDPIAFPPSPESSNAVPPVRLPEEILHANSVIQSLNASSTVAHMTGIGLKVIPSMPHLSSLRSVNLSGNFIVHIAPGSLPKGLHVLNLSRNKIHTIEGLRELTRLRVLDLSYNRISRIGQGLSNCALIKELYLSGNKISNVEGLHRLLKLTVLDLSFNKITTTKALGQLVANYNSVVALNLLGNPVQSNVSDDHLRRTVCGLLPKLAFLNKQPINTQKAREVGSDAVARAVLGSGSRVCARRKLSGRAAQRNSSTGSTTTAATSRRHTAGSGSQKNRQGLQSSRHHSGAKHRAH